MRYFSAVVEMIEYTLGNKRKRHIVGGVMLSAALFFGGCALTAMSLNLDEEDEVVYYGR